MSAEPIPLPAPLPLPAVEPIRRDMLPGLKILAVVVPVLAVAMLIWVWLWLIPAAVLLVWAGVMKLVRSINGGVAFRAEVWTTFTSAMVGFGPPLLAAPISALLHQSVGPLVALGVAVVLTSMPVFLATRRFVMWHKHPELLSAEAVGESWRRGTDGRD